MGTLILGKSRAYFSWTHVMSRSLKPSFSSDSCISACETGGFLTSLLFASVVFAILHRSEFLFLEFLLFALINFAIYEWRRSLAAPFFHHLTLNALIYGSQLALFNGLSGQ